MLSPTRDHDDTVAAVATLAACHTCTAATAAIAKAAIAAHTTLACTIGATARAGQTDDGLRHPNARRGQFETMVAVSGSESTRKARHPTVANKITAREIGVCCSSPGTTGAT
jgi:hypothetical protein